MDKFERSDFSSKKLQPNRLQPIIDKQLRSPIESPPKRIADIKWDTNKPADIQVAKWRGIQISRYLEKKTNAFGTKIKKWIDGHEPIPFLTSVKYLNNHLLPNLRQSNSRKRPRPVPSNENPLSTPVIKKRKTSSSRNTGSKTENLAIYDSLQIKMMVSDLSDDDRYKCLIDLYDQYLNTNILEK